MTLMRALFPILFAAIFFYIAHQLTRFAGLPLRTTLVVIGGLGVLFATVIMMPIFFWGDRRQNPKPWHDAYFDLAYFALAYINFILVFVILRDLAAFVINFALADFPVNQLYGAEATLWMLVAPLIFFALGTLVVRIGPKKKNVELRFPNLPLSFEGFRILHITDLHIGQNLPMNFVEKLVQKAQTVENVDIAVYTGDILDGLASRHETEVQLLKNIPSKYGHFFIPGNHEYYWKIDDAIAPFKRAGFRILMNQTEDIKINSDILQVSGIPDPASRMFNLPGPDLEKLKSTLKPGAFHLFLAHQPNIAPQAAKAGFDLQLSGHTHGGQFFPWNFLIGFFQTYAKGLYRIQDMQLYVNQGTGYWGPSLRLGTYCELTVITLKKST